MPLGPVWVWILAIALVSVICGLVGIGRFLDRRSLPSTPADAALVFGTGVPWKAESRLRAALWLHERGLACHFIVSGGVPMKEHPSMTEAEWLRARLIDRGVAPERVHMENRATNTAENVELAWPIMDALGVRSVVLVMSDFEGIRAHLTARRAWVGRGLRIDDWHARSEGHWHPWTWWLSPEGWHLTWYTVSRLFRYRLLRYLRQR